MDGPQTAPAPGQNLAALSLTPGTRSIPQQSIDSILHAESAILEIRLSGVIPPENFHGRAIDFGCGDDAAGAACLYRHGADVIAVELDEIRAEYAKRLALLPVERIIQADGLELLRSSPGSADLVSAFMLGPEQADGMFVISFLDAAARALRNDGGLLVTSDWGTIYILERLMNEHLFPFSGRLHTPTLWAGTRVAGQVSDNLDQVRASLPSDLSDILKLLKSVMSRVEG